VHGQTLPSQWIAGLFQRVLQGFRRRPNPSMRFRIKRKPLVAGVFRKEFLPVFFRRAIFPIIIGIQGPEGQCIHAKISGKTNQLRNLVFIVPHHDEAKIDQGSG